MQTELHELSVRERGVRKGGNTIAAYDPSGRDAINGQGRALLLVHGYNNSLDDGLDSFGKFIQSLESVTGMVPLPWPVFGVFWPGDEPNKAVSVLEYGGKINVARDSASKFFDYLRTRSGPGGAPMVLSIVAHSLGSRVSLELVERFRALSEQPGRANVMIDRVVLMAAAVPEARAEVFGSLNLAVRYCKGVCVLHSTGDRVLHFAFPPGQTSGGDGFFPTAVGRFGRPTSAWMQQTPMAATSGDQRKYDHGDYWPGRESAEAAAAFLRIPVPARPAVNTIGARPLLDPNRIAISTVSAQPSFL